MKDFPINMGKKYRITSYNVCYTKLLRFIAIDFASYLYHLLNHHVNILWNQHVVHHSSEEFNLACALRRPISNILAYFPLLLIPAAIFGVAEEIISFSYNFV